MPRFFHADLRVNGFNGKPVIPSPVANPTLRIVGTLRRQAGRGMRNFATMIAAWKKDGTYLLRETRKVIRGEKNRMVWLK